MAIEQKDRIEYSVVELVTAVLSPSRRDRPSQQVQLLRSGDIDGKPEIRLYHSQQGVELVGGTWSGLVPWTNVKRAVR